MTGKDNDFSDFWDQAFEEKAEENRREFDKANTPEAIALREEKRKAEIEREIRQGLRDVEGNWIETEETDEEDEDEDDDA